MKILTKKKQKEILRLLSEIGSVLAEDDKISVKTYSEIDQRNFDIAYEIGGFKGMEVYFKSIQSGIKEALAKMGE